MAVTTLTGRAAEFLALHTKGDPLLQAGADVVFAPGLRTIDDVRAVVSSVDRPVNVLVLAGCPTVGEVAEAGAARVSIGGALMYVAYAALIDAAQEFKDRGTYEYWSAVAAQRDLVRGAFS